MQFLKWTFLLLISGLILPGCIKSGTQDLSSQNPDYALEAAEVTPVLTGTTIPDVSLQSIEEDSLLLRQLIAEKPTVIIFYRGGWCPYCNKHLAQLQEAHSKLADLGYQILAISPDMPEFLKESLQEKDLGYTLLSDSDMEASKAFGLAFKVDQETVERYKKNGLDLAERSGHEHYLLPAPAVFLVNPDGLITFQYVNPDYKTRIKPDVLLAAAKAYYPEEG